MVHCATCGRMIAKRYLAETSELGTKTYCSEECLDLYHDYVLIVRGPELPAPAGYRRDLLRSHGEVMAAPHHLEERFASVRGWLFDVDGVLHVGSQPVTGAGELLVI